MTPERWWLRPVIATLLPVVGLAFGVLIARDRVSAETLFIVIPIAGLVATTGMIGVWVADAGRRYAERRLEIEQQRVQIEVETRKQQEGERRRFADLGVLAAGIAHELGQPLSAARVDIEGLHLLRQLGREMDPAHTQRVLSRVGTCILAMTQIVGHLRDLAADPTPTDAELKPIALDAVVRAVLGERKRWDVTGSIPIEWEAPLIPLMGRGDALGVRLVLVNLLRNACEAVAAGDPAGAKVRIVTRQPACLEVHDNGPGIPADRIARIFEPFVTTKGRARGVGLSLARVSAERMQADLSVVSSIGSGTIFKLQLKAP